MAQSQERFDAWNPGLESEIPAALLPRVTLYDPANSDTDWRQAREAAEFCGLRPQEMVELKLSRLALHEVLIRVTADLYVPDGPSYEELGLNLRSMAARILDHHVAPAMGELEQQFGELRGAIRETLESLVDSDLFAPASAPASAASKTARPRQGFLARLFGAKSSPAPAPAPASAPPEPPAMAAMARWRERAEQTGDPLEQACLSALQTVVGGILARRGRLMADRDLLVHLASILACNTYGSRHIGTLIDPIIRRAARAEGYRLLPYQDEPFVMNVKGASAAGKSTIRPLQRELAIRLGVNWEDFALVSPDYWRKFMLDYDSLGQDYKYAAMLTGQELEIIDRKLDVYMDEKAARGELPHLLIDRFRFDSFASTGKQQADGQLLSRFGHTVFMFFIITPPDETVERAWQRGKNTGRYKAVDDLLYHNIEAFTGMPQLFLTWVNKTRQKVHFEFLDNSVPLGQRPRTVAFGWNGEITILDPGCIRRLDSYRQINVEATGPGEVYLDPGAAHEDILATFLGSIPVVSFTDPETLQLQARFENGACRFAAPGFIDAAGLKTLCPERAAGGADIPPSDPEGERKFTIGDWSRA